MLASATTSDGLPLDPGLSELEVFIYSGGRVLLHGVQLPDGPPGDEVQPPGRG